MIRKIKMLNFRRRQWKINLKPFILRRNIMNSIVFSKNKRLRNKN
jgi:hypothetical protein